MNCKALFVSAFLAGASVSLASEPHNDISQNAGHNIDITPAARVTNGHVHGPFQLQQIIGHPKLAPNLLRRTEESEEICLTSKGDSGEEAGIVASCLLNRSPSYACPISALCNVQIIECPVEASLDDGQDSGNDKELPARSETSADPTYSIIFPFHADKVELRDSTEEQLAVRADGEISEFVQSAMPPSVLNALLNDPAAAAESLADEFSGDSTPEWYAGLPSSVQNYYATVTPPPMMTGAAISEEVQNEVEQYESKINAWMSSISVYNSQIGVYSASAAEESRQAYTLSQVARSNSIVASQSSDAALQTSAWRQSLLAASASSVAASESRLAASASRAVEGMEDKIEDLQNGAASTNGFEVALVSSILGAGACMALAFVL